MSRQITCQSGSKFPGLSVPGVTEDLPEKFNNSVCFTNPRFSHIAQMDLQVKFFADLWNLEPLWQERLRGFENAKASRLPRLLGLTSPTLDITMSPPDATSIADIRTLSIIVVDKFDEVLRWPAFIVFTDVTFQTQDCIFCNSQTNICVDCQVRRLEKEMKKSQKSAKRMEYLDLNGFSPPLQNSVPTLPFEIVSSTTNSLPWKLNDDVVVAKIKELRNSTFMYRHSCSLFLIVSQRTFTTPISHSPTSQTTSKHNINKLSLPANATKGRCGPAVFGSTGSSKQVSGETSTSDIEGQRGSAVLGDDSDMRTLSRPYKEDRAQPEYDP